MKYEIFISVYREVRLFCEMEGVWCLPEVLLSVFFFKEGNLEEEREFVPL